ncbi:hypothetical protein KBD20_02420 [Candidatus Saccharibacteria bacterium]|nr:hypothetical protein [Candidatus Saccharibacteria bacterium]
MVRKKKQSLRSLEKQTVDKMMGSVAFISPLSATPQIITIFGKQEAAGVSLISWSMYLVIGLITLAYGFFHKLRPIIISQTLWTIMNILIVIGVIMYGSGKSVSVNYNTLLAINTFGKTMMVLSFCFGIATLYFWYKLKQTE